MTIQLKNEEADYIFVIQVYQKAQVLFTYGKLKMDDTITPAKLLVAAILIFNST